MKKSRFNDWCKTAWLKCSLLISALMIILILVNWNTWSTALKCVAAIAALVPIHATEEWIFPGGFAYQYNLFLNKSDHPNAYPMNRASDMVTVLGTTIMYALLVLYFAVTGKAVPSGVLLGATGFSALEVSVHTYFGIRAYGKFKTMEKPLFTAPALCPPTPVFFRWAASWSGKSRSRDFRRQTSAGA